MESPRHPCPHVSERDRGVRPSSSTGGALGNALTALALGAGIAAVSVGVSRLLREPKAPVAEKRYHETIFGEVQGLDHGHGAMSPEERKTRVDWYFWMRDDDRKRADVLNHLKKENRYTRRVMGRLTGFTKKLYKEMKGHVKETDEDVPYKWGDWLYYSRTEKGKSYPVVCRKRANEGKEQIILDLNRMARGKKYFSISSWEPSPDHTLLGYCTDFKGYETYTIRFRKLEEDGSYSMLDDRITEAAETIAWGRDNSELFYGTLDKAKRRNKVWRHIIGTPTDADVCLYTENDSLFSTFFYRSFSDRFLYIGSVSSESSETHFIDLHEHVGSSEVPKLNLVAQRESDHLYDVEEAGSHFYIVTNADGATNFKIMKAPINDPSRKQWTDFLPYDPSVTIDSISCFMTEEGKPYGVIEGREHGLQQLWLLPELDVHRKYRLEFEQDLYATELGPNKEWRTSKLWYEFTSLTTPTQLVEYDVITKEEKLLKQDPCPNYDPKCFSTKRLEAVSEDGTVIPISLIWKKSSKSTGPRLCHLYGYGSFDVSVDPSFDPLILPIIDRGVVYAIAHVRGGGECGRKWYEDAKYDTKKKTFEDFIACAKQLISAGITQPSMLSIEGCSAGGLLIGSVLNMAPELFKAALAGVPFVDVLNTMSDPTLPLTTGEWLEWGNPHTAKFYDVISEYCPYSNVGSKRYPALLVTSGLYDSRVGYWEPAKWVAKLREFTTGDENILLKVDLDVGHFSASDRYHYLKERAFELAFLLDKLGAPREIID